MRLLWGPQDKWEQMLILHEQTSFKNNYVGTHDDREERKETVTVINLEPG